MAIELTGQRVTRVCFDYALTLLTAGGFELRIETLFSMSDAAGHRRDVEPTEIGVNAGSLLALLNQTVTSCSTAAFGALHLSFETGAVLSIEPHPAFEAWTITGSRGERAVCLPGGGLANWGADE